MDASFFSSRLKEARQKANLSQRQLSKLSGVGAATISFYEKNTDEKQRPSLENVCKLAEALKVSIDWLCGGEMGASAREKHDPETILNFIMLVQNYFDDFCQCRTEHEPSKDPYGEGEEVNVTTIRIESKSVYDFVETCNTFQELFKKGDLSREMRDIALNGALEKYSKTLGIEKMESFLPF